MNNKGNLNKNNSHSTKNLPIAIIGIFPNQSSLPCFSLMEKLVIPTSCGVTVTVIFATPETLNTKLLTGGAKIQKNLWALRKWVLRTLFTG